MRTLRYHLSVMLFDLAAWLYPALPCRKVGQAHHVGGRWLEWSVSRGEKGGD